MSFWNRNKKEDGSFTLMNEIFSRHAKSVNFVSRPGFKESLFIRLQAARHAASMPKFSFQVFQSLMFSGRRAFATVGVSALVIVVIATVVLQPFYGVKTVFAQDNFVLTAENSDALGIEPGSSFILESKEPVSVSDIKDSFTSSVEDDIVFDQISDKKIRVSFSEDLSAAKVVTFALDSETALTTGETIDRPYYWAFQVKSPFRIVGILPGNQTSGVAMDAGFEVTFNYEDVSLKDFERAFSISPKVKGHVEQSRRTFVFVPEENLEPRAVYTITIAGGLGLKGTKDTLGEDYIYSFETGESDAYRGSDFWVDSRYMSVTPAEKISFPYSAWSDNELEENIKVKVEIKQFISQVFSSDFQQYVATIQKARATEWQQFTSIDYLTDGASLSTVASFEAENAAAGWQKYAVFPEPLPRGYYIADLSCFGQHRYVFIESSQVTAYAAKAVNETFVWVNSAETGGPITGASVKFVGFDDQKVSTDQNGAASLLVDSNWDAADYAARDLLEIRSGSEAIILPLGVNYQPFYSLSGEAVSAPILSISQNYWTYLYSDRPMYQLTDTLKFWGYVEERDSGEKPDELRVVVGRRGGCSRFGCSVLEDDLVFDETKILVTEAGTFSGELALENIPEGRYQVTVYLGNEILTERDIAVAEYTKPAYTLSITPDVEAAWTSEPFGFTVHAEFFEGTPVKGLKVIATYEGAGQELTLDEVGNARGTFVSADWVSEDSGVNLTWMSVEPARPEEAGISATNQVMVFGPKVYLDSDWQNSYIENGVGVVKATVRNVQPINSWDPKVFAPTTRANQVVTGSVIETTYNKIEEGTTYDFVRKEVVTNYRYENVEKTIANFTLTSDENGEISYQFPVANSEANYHVELRARDENGKTHRQDIFIWQKDESSFYGFSPYLQFKDLNIPEGREGDFLGYNVGEQVKLQIQKDGAVFAPDANGRFVFFQAQRGIQEKDFQTSVDYNFSFAEEDVPMISVYGVYFNGSAYAMIDDWGWGGGHRTVYFDKSQKELTVSVQADKESYRPGEEVILSIQTSDKDGRGVSSEVNLNVVDEAFYSLVSESVDTLGSLYGYVSDGVLSTEASSVVAEALRSGAEKGGGGERGRIDFKDTAEFTTVKVDESGQTTYKFVLPDNITSWRVTAQAISSESKSAGNSQININASLPFFVVPVMRESYLLDDQPIVLLRSAGTDIGTGSPVEYTINVWDTDTKETKIALANETARFVLPDLSEGVHEITIIGVSGDLRDTITRSVKIVKSRLLEPVVSEVELGDETQLSGAASGLTYVTFVDAGRGQYYSDLKDMSWTFGDRADEILTRILSQEVLAEYFGEKEQAPETTLSNYQNDGVRLLPYGDVDFDLSVKIAMLGETQFDKNGLINYFRNQLYSGDVLNAEEASKAYAALAGLGEPVLAEVQRLSKEDGLGITEKMYLAMAMYLSGDGEEARAIYRELAKGLTEEYGYAFLPSDDLETQGEQTALMADLASALKEEKAEVLYDYVSKQYHGQTVVALEQIAYLKTVLKNSEVQKAVVSYILEGERREEELENGQAITLPLTADELLALSPKVEAGRVTAISAYNQPMVSLGDDVDSRLKLTRIYSVVGGQNKTEFDEGDLIRVDIKYDLPLSGEGKTEPFEVFEVTDVVPSGLSVLRPNWYNNNNCTNWPDSVEGQRISFSISNSIQDWEDECPRYTLSYYARVVTPGAYLAEPTFIRSINDPNDYNYLNESAIITIK